VYAGPSVAAAKPLPVAPGCTWSATPNGRTSSKCRISAACASAASCSGWTRRLSAARECGDTAFTALSTLGTSMPVTVIAGPDQTREPSPPVPNSGRSGSTSASSRNSSSL
jgi:hypothetical protein